MSYMPDVVISLEDAKVLSRLLLDPSRVAGLDESMRDLLTKLSDARIVVGKAVHHDTVRVGSSVTYEELPTCTRRSVTVVTPRDAEASAGRISVLSPVGRALLGHSTGHVISVALPTGHSLQVRLIEATAPELEAVGDAP